jgi:cytoskeletal protein CcmA (bactofilin family)
MSIGDEIHVSVPSDDLFAFARSVRVSQVTDNAFVLAEDLDVEAGETVDGDVYAIAGSVNVDGRVNGDLYAVAGDVVIGEGAVIAGDVHTAAGHLELLGRVHGDLSAGAGEVFLGGTVGGDVSVDSGQLTLGPNARVGGDLQYVSARPGDFSQGSVVGGDVVFVEKAPDGAVRLDLHKQGDPTVVIEVSEDGDTEEDEGFFSGMIAAMLWKSWVFTGSLLVGFAWLALGGPAPRRAANALIQEPGRQAGIGFVLMVLVPVVCVVAMALVIPLPLGVMGLVIYGLGIALAKLVAAQALGDAALDRMRPGVIGSPYMSMAVGLAALTVAGAIPWLGTLVFVAATVGGLGALWTGVRGAPSHPAPAR